MTPATPAPLVCPYCGRERSVSDVALRRTKCLGCGAHVGEVPYHFEYTSLPHVYVIYGGPSGTYTNYTTGTN